MSFTRRRGCAGLAGVLALALAGCATPRRPAAPGTEPPLAGRLLVRVEGAPPRSLSAGFELDGDAMAGRLTLTSPLGTTLGEARWAPGEALLVAADGTRRYDGLDSLAEEALGERVPIAALFFWLRGRPWPGAPSSPLPDGAPGFVQIGWAVDLSRQAEGWVQAMRAAQADAPAVTVRARLDRP